MADEKKIESGTVQNSDIGGERIDVRRVETVERNYDNDRADYRGAPAAIKRISWATVFAGVVITLVTQLLLSILGLGIGTSTVNPMSEQNRQSGHLSRCWRAASRLQSAVF